MDIEYNVIGKIFVENTGDFLKGMKSSPIQLVGSIQNGEKLECELKYGCFGFLLHVPQKIFEENSKCGVCVEIRLKNMIVMETGLYAAEMMDETQLKNICRYLSEIFNGEVRMGKSSEFYGNCNVYNGGSDYEVIEEKWLTCVYNKGCLLEVKKFTK